jgi:ornithine carbamoyltransferase
MSEVSRMSSNATSTARLRSPHLLKEIDLSTDEFIGLLDLAAALKHAKAAGTEVRHLHGKNVALIFEKASTRTRCAFEVAAFDQGAHPTQMLADMLTIREHSPKAFDEVALCYTGDGRNNVAFAAGHRRDARHGRSHRCTARARAR